ncbi:hypothetical protein DB346_06790 [Verrucomicrobia bacterium LW23]|nr:hypothetical protein DB346_06790 [Verrucomicrobia bacterium LW23]
MNSLIIAGTKSKSVRRNSRNSGYSLVELIVVIGVILVLAALITPSLSIMRGHNVTAASDLLAGQMELARQTAVAENLRTEFRIWSLPSASGGGSEWNAVQLYRVDSGEALGKLHRLPAGANITGDDKYSSIVGTKNPYGGNATVFNIASCPFKSVRFGPDGSTELDPNGPGGAGAWTLTVIPAGSSPSGNRPAKNFATLQVDPITGRCITYRP